MAATFTYEPGFTYATDPATVAHVQVGDTIHVDRRDWCGRADSFDAVVEVVGRDEFGMYFTVEYDDHVAHVRWRVIASTVVDRIIG